MTLYERLRDSFRTADLRAFGDRLCAEWGLHEITVAPQPMGGYIVEARVEPNSPIRIAHGESVSQALEKIVDEITRPCE